MLPQFCFWSFASDSCLQSLPSLESEVGLQLVFSHPPGIRRWTAPHSLTQVPWASSNVLILNSMIFPLYNLFIDVFWLWAHQCFVTLCKDTIHFGLDLWVTVHHAHVIKQMGWTISATKIAWIYCEDVAKNKLVVLNIQINEMDNSSDVYFLHYIFSDADKNTEHGRWNHFNSNRLWWNFNIELR